MLHTFKLRQNNEPLIGTKFIYINNSRDVRYSLADLVQYTRATLNAVSWNPGSKWPNDLEGQDQSPPHSIPVKGISRCIFGINWVILAQIYFMSLRGQAKFPRILSRNGQNGLEGQGYCIFDTRHKYPVMHFGANVVIPVKIRDELLRGQAEFPRILRKNGQNDLGG